MPIQPFSRSRSCKPLDGSAVNDDIDGSITDVACSFVSKRDEYNHEVGRTTQTGRRWSSRNTSNNS